MSWESDCEEAWLEIKRLRAEVATLREERSNLRAASRECRDHCVCAANAERELAEARRRLDGLLEEIRQFRDGEMICSNPVRWAGTVLDPRRAAECTCCVQGGCEHAHRYDCPARDEAGDD